MGILDGLNQRLGQLTPQQRAMLLRTAAATSRSPMGAKGFSDQAAQIDRFEMQRREHAIDDRQLKQRLGFEREKFEEALRRQQEARETERKALEAQMFEQEQFRTGMNLALPYIMDSSISEEERNKALSEIMESNSSKQFHEAMFRYGLQSARGPDTVVNVNNGENIEPTKASANTIQEQIMGARSQLNNLSQLGGNYSKDFLTYQGKAAAGAGRIVDKMGADSLEIGGVDIVKFNAEKGKFRSNLDQFFNEYRKYITGAAASMKELEMLKESLFSDDVGPKEFEARYGTLIEKIMTNLDENLGYATEGIPTEMPATPELKDENVINFEDM